MICFDFHRFLLIFWMLPVWKCRQYNTLGRILVQKCRQYNVFVRCWQKKLTVQRFWTVLVQKCRQYNVFGRSWRRHADSTSFLDGPGAKNADSTSVLDGPVAKMATVQCFWMFFVQKCWQYIVLGRSWCKNADSITFLTEFCTKFGGDNRWPGEPWIKNVLKTCWQRIKNDNFSDFCPVRSTSFLSWKFGWASSELKTY